ncbi:MAG: xanthine dehydrogenase family protein molybdopterin-binding subunit [Candidatus Korobacteraceae bacterium]
MATSTSTEERVAQGPVGQRVPRADGLEKVRGEPVYYGDFSLPGMLYGRVLRSRYPHARILGVDVSRAKALPGVAAVAVAADIPGSNKIGTRARPGDQPILCEDKVRFIGDAVALVAAETAEIASQALELIDVRYEELPPLLDPKEAMLPTAPRVHEDRSNIVHHFKLRKGNAEAAFRDCDIIVENVYETPLVEHAYLEVEGCVADKSGETMTVWSPSQYGFIIREQVAAMLNCPSEAVRVITTNAGGGFGGKEDACSDTACRAALLAHLTGRPVKLVHSRDESIISSSKRHAVRIEYKTGASKDGRLLAIEARAYLNKGAYASAGVLTPPAGGLTAKCGFHLPGPYDIANVHVDVYNVYTNLPFGGAMRGFGVPQMAFAHESQMDDLAHRLGIDPVEIRLLNGLEAGKRTAFDQLLEHSVGLKETIRRASELAGWKRFRQEKGQASGSIRRGIGVASFIFSTALGAWPEYANAIMEVDASARIVVRTGIDELGQGSRTALGQIAAQALEAPLDRILMARRGDTTQDRDSQLTVASRGTVMAGNAIIAAAKEARQTMLEMAAHYFDLAPEQMVLVDGEFHQIDGPAHLSMQEVLQYCFRCGRRLLGKGWWCVPKVKVDPETNLGSPYHAYAFGTQIAEVEVDIRTGMVKVRRVVSAQDVGKAINPTLVEAQIHGGVSMGLGFALSEEVMLNQGRVLNPSLTNYLIPTAADTPEIVSIIVEDPYPDGPFGAKGVGEPGAVPTAGAIANAVFDAVGVRITRLPITAERVWRALQERKKAATAR